MRNFLLYTGLLYLLLEVDHAKDLAKAVNWKFASCKIYPAFAEYSDMIQLLWVSLPL